MMMRNKVWIHMITTHQPNCRNQHCCFLILPCEGIKFTRETNRFKAVGLFKKQKLVSLQFLWKTHDTIHYLF